MLYNSPAFEAYKYLPREARKAICNGCGSKGGWFRPIHWWNIAEDCNAHDYAYFCGGTAADRKAADKDLRDAILWRIPHSKWYKRAYYRIQAWLYYRAVRMFGKTSFIKRPRALTLMQALDEIDKTIE